MHASLTFAVDLLHALGDFTCIQTSTSTEPMELLDSHIASYMQHSDMFHAFLISACALFMLPRRSVYKPSTTYRYSIPAEKSAA